MGLDLSYIAGEDHLQLRLSHVDWDILGILEKINPEVVAMATGVEDFGEPRTEKRLDLLKAVEIVLERLEQESGSLPYVYCHRINEGPYADDGGAGITGGIRIGGDDFWYDLESGLGRCMLIKRFLGPDGKVHIAEQKDLRGLKSLKTDNMGDIKIYRKKKATRLKQTLAKLKDFLASHHEENVTMILG